MVSFSRSSRLPLPPFLSLRCTLVVLSRSYLVLIASKVCNLAAPAFLGAATDAVMQGHIPWSAAIAYGLLRFGGSAFEELQRLVYLNVKQVGQAVWSPFHCALLH